MKEEQRTPAGDRGKVLLCALLLQVSMTFIINEKEKLAFSITLKQSPLTLGAFPSAPFSEYFRLIM